MQDLSCDSARESDSSGEAAPTQPFDQADGGEATQPVLDSEQLFRGGRVVHIQHEGALYQLRLTKLGKLILTK